MVKRDTMTSKNRIEKARKHYLRRLVEANGNNDERTKKIARESFYQHKCRYERLDTLNGFEGDVPEVDGYDSWHEFKNDWYL